MAILKGIKLLHKRYTTDQWKSGTEPYVLYLGEFGINLDTGEVRGYTKQNTQKDSFVTWDSAQPIGLDIVTEAGTGTEVAGEGDTFVDSISLVDSADGGKDYYKVTKKKLPGVTVTAEDSTTDTTDTVVSSVTKVNDHEIKVTTKKIPSASLIMTGGDGTDDITEAVDGKSLVKKAYVLDNITGSSTSHNHEIAKTFQEVTTAGYVDSRKLTATAGTQEGTQTGGTITYISSIEATNSNGNHTLTYKTKQFTTPGADTTPVGEVVNNTEKKVVTGAKLDYDSTTNKYNLSGLEKELVATGKDGNALTDNSLKIVGSASEIQFQLDLSAYATKDDISAITGAMTFRGTLGETGTVTLESAINEINSGSGSAPLNGDTYKFITNAGTYTEAKFVLSDGTTTTSITPDRGDIITYTGGKWYLIPSGDEADGTVTTLKEGQGINFKNVEGTVDIKDGTITGTGTIEHIKYTNTDATSIVTGAVENADGDEVYEFVESISTDKDGLGHVVGATKKAVTIPSWDNIHTAIEAREHISIVKGYNNITVTPGAETTNSDGNKVITYTVTHDAVDTSTTGKTKVQSQAGSGRTYVTGVYRDEYGHISHVTTATETVQDTNTWRPVKVGGEELLDDASNKAALDIISGTNVTVETTTTAGQVKISTLGAATKDNYGFFKARYSGESVSVSNPTTNTKAYGLGIDTNGYGYVKIDDPTIDRHHTIDDAKKQRDLGFYAISTDARGHIEALELITTLDGNMPENDGLDTNTTKDNQEVIS